MELSRQYNILKVATDSDRTKSEIQIKQITFNFEDNQYTFIHPAI